MAAQPVTLTSPPPPPAPSGVKTFICGPQGVGKTHSLRTLLDPRLKLQGIVALFTEPSTMDVFGDLLDDTRLYWNYLPPFTADWKMLIEINKMLNLLSNDSLQKVKGIQEGKFTQMMTFLELCNNFKDSKGRRVGDIAQLDTSWAVAIDSLTGLNKMAKSILVGAKSALTSPDWGISMDNLQRIIDTLAVSLKSHLVITAHTEWAMDDVTTSASNRQMISTLGRKLGPVLGVNFSEIILARREGTSYYWSTSDPSMALRTSYLGLGDKIAPSFVGLLEAWKRKGAKPNV